MDALLVNALHTFRRVVHSPVWVEECAPTLVPSTLWLSLPTASAPLGQLAIDELTMSQLSGEFAGPQLTKEALEVIAICVLGILCYLFMVLFIVCRGPARLAEGLHYDVDHETYQGRRPEDDSVAYFEASRIETIREDAGEHSGKILLYRGEATFKNSCGETARISRRRYAAFRPREAFDLVDRTEDIMFYIELFDSGTELVDVDNLKKSN